MSTDNPRRRIDWNGEGLDQGAAPVLKSRSLLRKASVPAAIGLAGLALVGALAAGPLIRSMASSDTATNALVAETVDTAALAQPEPAEETAIADAPALAAAEPARTAAPEPTATTQSKISAPTQSAGLAADDPRWSAEALSVDEDKLTALKQAVDETVAAAEIAGAMGNIEGLTTSGIPATAAGFAPSRPASPASERSAFDAALVTEDEKVEAEPVVASSNLSPAKATQYVNMRAAPEDGAAVLTVVPANASIEAETDCRWCEVSYKGQKGYIFQSFITR
ncbi:SH3 domain-containing protein [Aliihoeflea sp. 40Bstr573]|uniref:SH3 domain-containing protein n=1 Tax=Aliihoeflea sp. 40Bstr573 TaxID=2696467 RepID=UPI002095BD57|nr:SH3 domain-containing protein [Aliihoeflea sp. 40Bstr573]MCO6388212.1 hypothetical protein [Aliihoeflea sp. 40Bstr573]